MKKIFTIEKSIYRFVKQENLAETRTLDKVLDFWKLYDSVFGTNHVEIVKALYVNNFVSHSCTYKIIEFHLSESSLTRYRKMYIKSFCAINAELQHLID